VLKNENRFRPRAEGEPRAAIARLLADRDQKGGSSELDVLFKN
jgi:hypothetical protein